VPNDRIVVIFRGERVYRDLGRYLPTVRTDGATPAHEAYWSIHGEAIAASYTHAYGGSVRFPGSGRYEAAYWDDDHVPGVESTVAQSALATLCILHAFHANPVTPYVEPTATATATAVADPLAGLYLIPTSPDGLHRYTRTPVDEWAHIPPGGRWIRIDRENRRDTATVFEMTHRGTANDLVSGIDIALAVEMLPNER
jgi:hypothetical protein